MTSGTCYPFQHLFRIPSPFFLPPPPSPSPGISGFLFPTLFLIHSTRLGGGAGRGQEERDGTRSLVAGPADRWRWPPLPSLSSHSQAGRNSDGSDEIDRVPLSIIL